MHASSSFLPQACTIIKQVSKLKPINLKQFRKLHDHSSMHSSNWSPDSSKQSCYWTILMPNTLSWSVQSSKLVSRLKQAVMLLENSQAEHLEGGESQQKEAEREADQQLKVPLQVVFGSGIAGLEEHVTASDTGQSCNQVSTLAFGT